MPPTAARSGRSTPAIPTSACRPSWMERSISPTTRARSFPCSMPPLAKSSRASMRRRRRLAWLPPTITDDGFYVGSGDMHYYKLDRPMASVVWSFPLEAAKLRLARWWPMASCTAAATTASCMRSMPKPAQELWNVPLDGAVGRRAVIGRRHALCLHRCRHPLRHRGMGDATPAGVPASR